MPAATGSAGRGCPLSPWIDHGACLGPGGLKSVSRRRRASTITRCLSPMACPPFFAGKSGCDRGVHCSPSLYPTRSETAHATPTLPPCLAHVDGGTGRADRGASLDPPRLRRRGVSGGEGARQE